MDVWRLLMTTPVSFPLAMPFPPDEPHRSGGIIQRVMKNKLENEYALISTEPPKYGDVIFCRRELSLYKHFGIYIDAGRVIHFAAKGCDIDYQNAVIHETSLEDFARGDKVYVMNFPEKYHAGSILRQLVMGKEYQLQSPEETVRRAKSKLGKRGVKDDGYHLLLNNCEDFAIWCKTDVFESRQLNSYIDALLP